MRRDLFEVGGKKKDGFVFDSPQLQAAYEAITKTLEGKRISERAFSSLYGDAVTSDIATGRNLQAGNELTRTERGRREKSTADLLEGLIHNGVNEGQWFGENAKAFPASIFDDYVHGIDQIIRFSYSETASHSYLGLAMDVTSSNPGIVYEKVEAIKVKIDKGELGTIKYFSDGSGFRGSSDKVPQVVVGIEPERVEALALSYQADADSFKKNPAQMLFLMQIIRQMKTFKTYTANSAERKVQELAPIFAQEETRITRILNGKKGQKLDWSELTDDVVYRSICQALTMFR